MPFRSQTAGSVSHAPGSRHPKTLGESPEEWTEFVDGGLAFIPATEDKEKAGSVFSSPSVARSAAQQHLGTGDEQVPAGPWSLQVAPSLLSCSFAWGEGGSTRSCLRPGVAAGCRSPSDTG